MLAAASGVSLPVLLLLVAVLGILAAVCWRAEVVDPFWRVLSFENGLSVGFAAAALIVAGVAMAARILSGWGS